MYEISIKSNLYDSIQPTVSIYTTDATELGFVFNHDKYDYGIFYSKLSIKIVSHSSKLSNSMGFVLSSFYWPPVTFDSMTNWLRKFPSLRLLCDSAPISLAWLFFRLHNVVLISCSSCQGFQNFPFKGKLSQHLFPKKGY